MREDTLLRRQRMLDYDTAMRTQFGSICGVDEAGRGPLAGDVYAAAVILPEDHGIEGLDDSKKLSEKRREALFDEIQEKAAAWCIATASIEEIERLNILQAAKTTNLRGMSMSFQRGPEQLATHLQPFQGLTFPLFICCSAREPRSGLEACTSTPDQRAVQPKSAESRSAVSLMMIIFTATMTMI